MQIVLFLIMLSLSGMRAFDSQVPLLPKRLFGGDSRHVKVDRRERGMC